MNDLMVSVSGIRGIYGVSLTAARALTFAANFGIFCKREKIVVGRDSRTTGPALLQAVTSGLMSVGCDVIDLGIVPTPTTLLAVKNLNAAGGLCLTASHNPPEWNALKLIGANGMFLFPEVAEEFISGMRREPVWSDWRHIGYLTSDNTAVQTHIDKILSLPYLDLEAIRKRNFKVVIDSVNGAGGLISPILLKKLGCEVIELNSEPTGIFSHPAEPLNQNLTALEEAVKKSGADIGFATDPDVDRLSIVSEKGNCIGEEYTVVLAELFVLPKQKGDIVVNLSSSMLSDYIAAQFGVQVHRTKVGEINVGKKMLEIQSPIGGEGNGGVICPAVNYARDALTGMALVLGLLAEQKAPLSEIVNSLPHYYTYKDKISSSPDRIEAIMQKASTCFDGLQLDTQDGIKASGDNFWVHIRKSGTEPVIRIYVESDDYDKSKKLCRETIGKLTSDFS